MVRRLVAIRNVYVAAQSSFLRAGPLSPENSSGRTLSIDSVVSSGMSLFSAYNRTPLCITNILGKFYSVFE